MNLNKFTEKAQESVLEAQRLAQDYDHSEIRPSHLLLALLQQEGGVVPQIAHHLSVNPDTLAQGLKTELNNAAKVYGGSQPSLSRALNNVLRAPRREKYAVNRAPRTPASPQKTDDRSGDVYVQFEH